MYAKHAANAYKTQSKETLSPRAIEYRVFSQVTGALEQLQNSEIPSIQQREEALHNNHLLWSALAADVMHETNLLPEGLKSQILYLTKYMGHHTEMVRKGEADVQAMIDINKSIMSGLSVNPQSKVEQQQEITQEQ